MFFNKSKNFEDLVTHNYRLFFLFLIILLYGKTLTYDFVWDDYVLYDDFIQKSFYSLLFSKLDSIYSVHYYPILLISHKIDFLLSNLIFFRQESTSHFIYAYIPHFTNLIIYYIGCIFFYKCSEFFFKDKIICLLLSVIFLAHPIHVNSVAWISGRTDLLSTTFCLISLYYFLKLIFTQYPRYILISASWYFLAVFSKIVAVNFLFVFILTFTFFFFNNRSKFNKNFKIFFLNIIFILCIYFFALFNFSQLNNDINSISIIESFQNIKLINILKLLGYYFEKGFFPLYHDILFFELETYKISIVKFLLFFLALYYSVHQYLKNRNEPTILFLSLFFLTLTTSYYSYFKSLDNTDLFSITSVAERYVFMPSIFAVLFFGSLIAKVKEKFKILSLTLLIFIFFIISFMRIDAYKNDLTFATYTPYDRKTKFHFSYLHQIHLENNNIHLAEKAIQEGLDKFPDYHEFYLLMSNIENKKNNFEQAEIFRTKARELSKDDPEFNFYAGKLFFQQAKYVISEKYLIRSLDLGISPKIKNQALILLGRIELARYNIDKGIEYFEKPLINHKDYADSYFYLGKAFLLKKDKQKASEFFLKAIEIDKSYLEIIKK